MGYEWDVFISYRRKDIPKRWMEKIFLPLFTDYLQEALGGRSVKVYRDKDGIEGGSNWKMNIKRALATSRCLVPILLPSYFHSDWCRKEIAVIYNRQRQLGYSTLENPNGLIVPVKIRDGKFFPKSVSDLQILDCNDYYRVGSGLESTELYINLQTLLLQWVDDVAEAINSAPEWDEEWLKDEWLEIPTDRFLINGTPMKNPTL